MDNNGKKPGIAAKILLLIPICSTIFGILMFILACILEQPTSRGTFYTIVISVSLICFVFSAFPGIILAIIGLILAIKDKLVGFIILGIAEVGIAVVSFILMYIVVFVTGPSV